MAIPQKQKRDILRTIGGFAAAGILAAGLIFLGNRNDAVSEAERLKAGILTAHEVKAAFQSVGGRLVERPVTEGQRVRAGELLLGIDGTDIRISIEAPVAVVDLDQSRWSAALVEKLNASPSLSVRAVVHSPSDPRAMTRGDRFVGVVYIPKGAQARILRGDRTLTIGYFADDSNTAQNGEVYSVLNEIAAELGAERAVSRSDGVSSLGKNSNETQALMSPLRMGFRYLTNPTGQATTATVVSFLLFFSMMYHGLVSLMIVGRLRVTRSWDGEVLSGSFFGFLARGVPYAFIFTAVVTTALAVLILLG